MSEPWLDDGDVRIHVGDVREVLANLADESVDCVITSPPYWGLRSYIADGHDDKHHELGLEPTPDLYVANMVAVFREVRRVLAPHGTCWLNLGDSYAGTGAVPGEGWDGHGGDVGSRASWAKGDGKGIGQKRHHPPGGLKPKDLVGIPWRVAFALQADGWWLRSDIIWSKPNPMPESVTDRPTKAHEYVFLLTRQPRYWFDDEAVREPYDSRPQQRLTKNVDMPLGSARVAAGVQQGNPQGGTHVSRFAVQNETLGLECGCNGGADLHPLRGKSLVGFPASGRPLPGVPSTDRDQAPVGGAGRNVRSVWEIATQPYAEAHFATFPEELVRRCLLAGCPEWVCRVCHQPRERIMDRVQLHRERPNTTGTRNVGGRTDGYTKPADSVAGVSVTTLGWSDCGHGEFRAGVVLDPFLGSGTTALVARKHGRHAVGIELSEDYAALAGKRLQQLSLLA